MGKGRQGGRETDRLISDKVETEKTRDLMNHKDTIERRDSGFQVQRRDRKQESKRDSLTHKDTIE